MKQVTIRFWLLYLVVLIPFSILAGMLMKYNQTGNAFHPTVVIPIFVIFLMGASIGSLILFMINKAKKYSQAQLNKFILPALLLFYAAAFLLVNLSVAAGDLGWFIFKGIDLSGFWPSLKLDLSFANGRFYVWLMIFTIAFFYTLWQKSAKKEQKLIEDNLKHRYNTLKSQVNPHFLFNSLNTLSELVYIDPKRSDLYIQTLSGIYRYVLENEETELIDLEKEIEFVKQYFSLQQVRDAGKISLEIAIDDSNEIKIIPVSLQLLIENALKHNTMSIEKPLKIKIFLTGDYIVVSNSLQKKKSVLANSTQIGLSNLKDRTKIIMDKDLEINNENNSFTVKLSNSKAKMKVLIIEDEELAAKKLLRLLKETDAEIEVAGILGAVEKAVNWLLSNQPPDLIFMDVQLEDGLCFDIFEKIKINTPVIFTTAYDEYTLKAFKVNSVDYLLKPVKPTELKNAINKFNKLHKSLDFVGIELALKQILPKKKERFLIKVGEHYKSIEISEIDCFYIKERCNFIHTFTGKNYGIDYSLDKIEEMIDPKMFFRINRNMIVNLLSIQDILAYSSSRLKISLKNWADNEEILLSRDRVADFKLWMDK